MLSCVKTGKHSHFDESCNEPSADLSGATDLVEVTFRGNDLEYVPEDLLKHNGRLQRLDLSGNR